MDKNTFESHKADFYNLTGQSANDNLEAYFAYINTILLMDIKDRVDTIRMNQPKPDPFKR